MASSFKVPFLMEHRAKSYIVKQVIYAYFDNLMIEYFEVVISSLKDNTNTKFENHTSSVYSSYNNLVTLHKSIYGHTKSL